MRLQTTRGRLLASTIICGAALAAAAPAFAQETTSVDAVVITGSRIPQPNLVGTSPVTQVTSEDITSAGVSRVEDLVNSLPQAFAAQNSTVSNGASGTATVNLRGLGSVRTLVLIDGRRMPYGSPNDPAADLNQIPSGMVERVEVLTGGASAVYGSDAIAGVVNFIMKKDFEGVQLTGQYSFYQHNNDFDGAGNIRAVIAGRAVTNPKQFKLPGANVTDGYGKEITAIMGVNAPDGRGNMTAYVSYRKNDEVMQADRDFSACSIGAATATTFTCGGSSTAAPGRFNIGGVNYTLNPAGAGNTFQPFNAANDQYNFGPINFFQRPDERYSLGAMGHYEINEHFDVFTQLMFTDYSTVAQIAPSGAFYGNSYSTTCGNPLLSAAQRTTFGCAPGDTTTVKNLLLGRRNVEGGGRQDDLRYQSFRGVIGTRGTITDGWNYDFSAQFSRVQLSRIYRNDFSINRISRSLDVITGPTFLSDGVTPNPQAGMAECRATYTGADANCVPWNVWQIGGVSNNALAYLQTPGIQTAWTTQQVVTFAVNGDLSNMGVKSPYADRGVLTAFGVEYRRDALSSDTDTAFATGDLAGQGGPTIGLAGSTEVYDIFAEVVVPLVEGRQFAELLSVEAAYRFSDYGSGLNTDTYKIAGDWAPTSDVRFRASFQRAVRAPNVIELFTAQGLGLFDIDGDPCGDTGSTGVTAATLAQCVATGVPALKYGSSDLDSPAGQFNLFGGGNANLKPETADTVTYGVVFTPSFIPRLSVSVDYFDIDVADRIDTYGADNTLAACYQGNVALACSRIHRNALGDFWTQNGFIDDFNINTGGLKTTGYDIVGNYGMDIGEYGSLTFNLVGTLLKTLETDPGPGAVKYDCVGYYGNQCGIPNPEWRHRARVAWESPWNARVALTWRHFGQVDLFGIDAGPGGKPGVVTGRVDSHFKSEDYFDVSGSWEVKDGVTFRGGVNNIFDNDPQLSASVGTTGNGNTYPQTYDSMGRYIFMGVTLDF